jgi:hypothetical protein
MTIDVMNNRFKYFTVGKKDSNCGLFLNVAGSSTIESGNIYPPVEHPSGYYFNWKEGRVLHEYQISDITEGSGVFENEHGKFSVNPDSNMFTFPGIRHRYKPTEKTGWKENYIGFNGKITLDLFNHPLFTPRNPVLQIGIKEELLNTYLKIFDLVEREQPGFQQIASGMVMKLLGYIISIEKQKDFSGKRIAMVIEEARFMMRQHMEQEINLEQIAEQHHVGYSYFRQMFRKKEGMNPSDFRKRVI